MAMELHKCAVCGVMKPCSNYRGSWFCGEHMIIIRIDRSRKVQIMCLTHKKWYDGRFWRGAGERCPCNSRPVVSAEAPLISA